MKSCILFLFSFVTLLNVCELSKMSFSKDGSALAADKKEEKKEEKKEGKEEEEDDEEKEDMKGDIKDAKMEMQDGSKAKR